MLCSVCLNILHTLGTVIRISRTRSYITVAHHNSIKELTTAAENGCFFCRGFWNQYSLFEQDQLLQWNFDAFEAPYGRGSDGSTLGRGDAYDRRYADSVPYLTYVLITKDYKRPGLFTFSIHWELSARRDVADQKSSRGWNLVPTNEEAEARKKLTVPDSTNTASAQSWALVEKWIENCVKYHKHCNMSEDTAWYPKRLLDLRRAERTVRVIETDREHCSGRYVTLSHRWGGVSTLSLTQATEDELKRGVPTENLPLLFRDCITICRRLSVSFLWIDSVCILQDDNDLEDWMRESAAMNDIYSKSYLNLSALHAPDCHHGLFADRDPDLLIEKVVSSPIYDLEIGQTWRDYRIVQPQFWIEDVSDMPLNLRGWVLQERLLAPRILHFGRHQLSWECCETEASESFPNGISANLDPVHGLGFKSDKQALQHGDLNSTLTRDDRAHRQWVAIVEAYTKCEITKPEDKLIAISGIVKYMSLVFQDTYIAGLWQNNFTLQLLWYVRSQRQQNGEASYRPQIYRAPSFSWASVEGAVTFSPGFNGSSSLDFLEVSIEHVNSDVTGLVKSASLLLRCKLQPIVIANYYGSTHLFVTGVEENSPLIALDQTREKKFYGTIKDRVFGDEDAGNRLTKS